MFPHFITSRVVHNRLAVLWQFSDYEYRIDYIKSNKLVMNNTPFESAMEQFNKFCSEQ